MSTLIKDNGKTQEEIDVEQLVKQTVQNKQLPSEATDDSEDYEI